MVAFLSDAWLDAMAAAAADVDVEPPAADATRNPFTLRQVVTDGPDGTVTYDLRLTDTSISVDRRASGDADVTFSQDHATAGRLARGESHPQVELTAGRLTIAGSANRLTEWRGTLDALHEGLAALRASTTW